jgi:hypothetical protein
MLHAGWQNDDVPSRVFFRAFLGSAFATSFKNDNDLFCLMKMPRNGHPWARDVLMNVRLGTKLFVCDEIAHSCTRAARDLTKSSTQNCSLADDGGDDLQSTQGLVARSVSFRTTMGRLVP